MKKFLFLLLLLIPFYANATITGSCVPNRTSGVAPLGVFFDATATTSTVYPTGTGSGYLTNGAIAQGTTVIPVNTGTGTILAGDYIQVAGDTNQYKVTVALSAGSLTIASPGVIPAAGWGTGIAVSVIPNNGPFHKMHYSWNLGDLTGSTVYGKLWQYGTGYNRSRNSATGAIAAHMYETAGTYTWRCTALDNSSTPYITTGTITVYDPADVTHGLGTPSCFYSSTPFASGTCAGHEQLNSNFQSAVSSAITAGAKWILFKRGDIFTTGASYTMNTAGPGIIGAYGNSASSVPAITTTANIPILIFNPTSVDWRIMDMYFDGGTTNTSNVLSWTVGTTVNITALRLQTNQMINLSNMQADGFFLQDSILYNYNPSYSSSSSYGDYCPSCIRHAVLGNSISMADGTSSDDIRLQGCIKCAVQHTTFTNPDTTNAGPITIRGDSQYVDLSDSDTTGNFVSVNPQNSGSTETQRDITIQRNHFTLDSHSGQAYVVLKGSAITARNNIFNLSAGANHVMFTSNYDSTVGSPIPERLHIYNNSAFNSAGGTTQIMTWTTSALNTACNSDVSNNVIYGIGATAGSSFLEFLSTCVVTGSDGTQGNSSIAQKTSTDPYPVSSPASILDYRCANTSIYSCDGTSNGVVDIYPDIHDDFLHCDSKTAAKHAGAFVPTSDAICSGVR